MNLLYIRQSFVVGQAGIGLSLLVISGTCLCAFLTALSVAALSSNGRIREGGPYFLISRTLGPEVGVSIGLLFWLSKAVVLAIYILGAVEALLFLGEDLQFEKPEKDGNKDTASELVFFSNSIVFLS